MRPGPWRMRIAAHNGGGGRQAERGRGRFRDQRGHRVLRHGSKHEEEEKGSGQRRRRAAWTSGAEVVTTTEAGQPAEHRRVRYGRKKR